MKDEDTANKEWIESAWTDFLSFLDLEKFSQCRALIEATGENGFEDDARKMHQKLNAKIAEVNDRDDVSQGEYDPDNYRPQYPHE